MAGHEDLCDHPVPLSFHANITLPRFAQGPVTAGGQGCQQRTWCCVGSLGICSPRQRSSPLQPEWWATPAPRPNPGLWVSTSRNEGRSQPRGVEWHRLKWLSFWSSCNSAPPLCASTSPGCERELPALKAARNCRLSVRWKKGEGLDKKHLGSLKHRKGVRVGSIAFPRLNERLIKSSAIKASLASLSLG